MPSQKLFYKLITLFQHQQPFFSFQMKNDNKSLKKPCYSGKSVQLENVWTQFITVLLRNPCSSEPCSSGPYCTCMFTFQWDIITHMQSNAPCNRCSTTYFIFFNFQKMIHLIVNIFTYIFVCFFFQETFRVKNVRDCCNYHRGRAGHFGRGQNLASFVTRYV